MNKGVNKTNGFSEISTIGMSHADWLAERRKSIGGSDAATIVGINPYSSRYELWADKLEMIPPKDENEAMRIGHDLEDYVAKRFCEATGKKVRRKNAVIRSDKYPFAHANVDRLIVGEAAGLECKTTSVLNLSKFKNGDFPANYYVQCQHYMMVTGLPKWYLAVLILGREFLWFEIPRDDEDIEALAAAELEFQGYVDSKTPPPVDGSHSCTDTLATVYAESNGEIDIVDLTPCAQAVEIYLNLRGKISELTQLKNEQENLIKSYMGCAEKGTLGDCSVSWKTTKRRTFDSKRFIADHPETDFGNYIKISSCRIFKIK